MLRDAQGNVLAIYQKKDNNFVWKEQHLYGSSRLGILQLERPMASMSFHASDLVTQNQGTRQYELTNHLGNVLSTITDKGVITSAQDYYPFGLTLASRSFTEGGSVYRFGFNGQEKTPEFRAGHTTATFWEYDARLGRRWNIDIVTRRKEGSYTCFHDNPILFSDVNGADPTDRAKEYAQRKGIAGFTIEASKKGRVWLVWGAGGAANAKKFDRNFFEKAAAWWNNHEFYAKSGGELSLGAQAGLSGSVTIPQAPNLSISSSLKVNLGTARLYKIEKDSKKELKRDWIGKNGFTHITQEVSLSVALKENISGTDLVAANIYWKSEFDGYDGGYDNLTTEAGIKETFFGKDYTQLKEDFHNDKTKGSKLGGRFNTAKLNGPTLKATDKEGVSIGVNAEAALLLGVKVEAEIGMRIIPGKEDN